MNQELETYTFNTNTVRIIPTDNELWFVAKDVCDVLSLTNVGEALRALDDDERNTISISDGNRGNPNQTVISEAGFYKLVLRSRKPVAKEFQRWVTHEVLPSIRKHSGYMAGQEHMTPEQMLAASMRWLESRIAEQQAQLDAQKPKVALAEAINNSSNTILIGELAKILTQNGARQLGTRQLFARLRADGFLCRQHGEMWNLPTQRAMNMGLFEVVKRPVPMPDGSVRVTRTTKVTGKGQEYFINRYLHADDAVARRALTKGGKGKR